MFITPLEQDWPVTAGFGEREPIALPGGGVTLPFHYGIDYAAPAGTPVRATHGGVVEYAGWDYSGYGGGYMVTLDGGDWRSKYMHLLEPPAVRYGQVLAQGEHLGIVGSTGASLGDHLHYEQHHHGVPVDPAPLLRQNTYEIGEDEMFVAIIDGRDWYLVIPQGTGKPKAVILYGESGVAERNEFPQVRFSHANAKKAFWSAVDRA